MKLIATKEIEKIIRNELKKLTSHTIDIFFTFCHNSKIRKVNWKYIECVVFILHYINQTEFDLPVFY